jgi:DNA-binding GntR family transcriptional regulator
MAKILEAMDRAIAREAFQTYRRLDADFHMALIEGAGNSYLVSAYGLIAAKIGALRSRAHDDTQVVDRSLETHRRLYQLLEAGEERKFNELLGVHIANTGRDYRAWLARQAAAGDDAAAGLSSPVATESR